MHSVLNALAPEIAADISQFWDQPFHQYARHLYRARHSSDDPYRIALRKKFDELVGREVTAVDTAGHLHFIADPLAWEPTYIARLASARSGTSNSFSILGAGVTMESHSRTGPGWATFKGESVPLFELPRRALWRTSLCANAPTTLSSQIIDIIEKETGISLPRIDGGCRDILLDINHNILNAIDGYGHGYRHSLYDEAIAVKLYIWDLSVNGLATRLLTSLEFLQRWQSAFEQFQSRSPMASLFGPKNVMPFRLLEKGKLQDLTVIDGFFVPANANLPETRIPITPSGLNAALYDGLLWPTPLGLLFITSLLPGVRALGGRFQIVYLTNIRNTLLDVLNPNAGDEYSLIQLLNAWGGNGWSYGAAAAYADVSPSERLSLLSDKSASSQSRTLREVSDDLIAFRRSENWNLVAQQVANF